MILAHNGGIDEIAFVALPVLVFVTLQYLNRRKNRQAGEQQENEGPGPNETPGS